MNKIYFLGCYTTKINNRDNLGDYMYADIFRHYFKDYNIIIGHKNNFDKYNIKKNDIVIYGGGGLFYDKIENINIFLKNYKLLKERNIKYILFSIGLQFNININDLNLNDNLKQLIPFFTDAYKIYTRSFIDYTILKKYNLNTIEMPDLCFSLSKLKFINLDETKKIKNYIITIGNTTHLKKENVLINQLINNGFKHFHLIFSKDDLQTNWNEINIKEPITIHKQNICDYIEIFNSAQYVFSTRFHGILFAKLCKVQHIIPLLPTYKLLSLNNTNETLFYLEDLKTIINTLNK